MKKTSIENLLFLFALFAVLDLSLAGRATGQTFTTLRSFSSVNGAGTNGEGANPEAGLILSGNTLYGTTYDGGTNGYGAVFAIHTGGTGFAALHSFTNNGTDGIYPRAGLFLSGNTLYGTTYMGGINGDGTIFAINTNGTGFTTVYSFGSYVEGPDPIPIPSNPRAGLILSGNTFYGTTEYGGTNGYGTVFAVNTDGTSFRMVHSFDNSDGANPVAGLILAGNTLYATTEAGGVNGSGTVFKVNTDGTGFMTLYTFTNGSDGALPQAGLILSGNTLYGTANEGGTNLSGSVFAVQTDSTHFTTLHSLGSGSDGGYPRAGLVLSGNTLYGTAEYGGTLAGGSVFAVNTNGTSFTTLYAFTNAPVGTFPYAGLALSGNTLYGTTYSGGTNGNGTVFSLSYQSPRLNITRSGTKANVAWPSGLAGFSYSSYTLQSATNLVSTAVWGAVSPPPVVVNTNYVVTNTISGGQMFYRLSQ